MIMRFFTEVFRSFKLTILLCLGNNPIVGNYGSRLAEYSARIQKYYPGVPYLPNIFTSAWISYGFLSKHAH
jgi:hypothetical protein